MPRIQKVKGSVILMKQIEIEKLQPVGQNKREETFLHTIVIFLNCVTTKNRTDN